MRFDLLPATYWLVGRVRRLPSEDGWLFKGAGDDNRDRRLEVHERISPWVSFRGNSGS